MNKFSRLLIGITMGMFLILSYVTQAQISISGTITEHSSGSPLSNVSISFDNTGPIMTTDLNGYFALEIARNGLLIFTLSGYESDSIYKVQNVFKTIRFCNCWFVSVCFCGYEMVTCFYKSRSKN